MSLSHYSIFWRLFVVKYFINIDTIRENMKKIYMGESVKYDKPLISILLPLIGWPIGEITTQIMKYFGLTNLSAFEALSLMLLREPSWLLGILVVLIFNAWASLGIYYLPKILGPDHFPFKSMLVAMTGEALLFNVYGILGKNEGMVQSLSKKVSVQRSVK